MNTTTAPRTNRYAGTCTKCRATVAAGAGILTGHAGAWTTEHTDCAAFAAARADYRAYTGNVCDECGQTRCSGECGW